MELLMRYISRISRLADLYRSDKLEEYGLNGTHHSYILNLCRNPGISQEKLAQMIFVDKSNVARQLAVLEQKGYVTRSASTADRRQMLVFPTEKALQVYPVVMVVLRDWNAAILEDFTEEEQQALVESMKKIMDKAKTVLDSLTDENRD